MSNTMKTDQKPPWTQRQIEALDWAVSVANRKAESLRSRLEFTRSNGNAFSALLVACAISDIDRHRASLEALRDSI